MTTAGLSVLLVVALSACSTNNEAADSPLAAGVAPSGLPLTPQNPRSEDANSRPEAESSYATTLAGRKARLDAANARSDQAVEAANARGSYLTPFGNADTGKVSRRPISELESSSRKAIATFLEDRERLTEVGVELAEITETTSLPRFLDELKRRHNSRQFLAAHENRLNLKAALEREQARLQGAVANFAERADGLLDEFGLLGGGLDSVMQLSDSEVEEAIAYAVAIDEGREVHPQAE